MLALRGLNAETAWIMMQMDKMGNWVPCHLDNYVKDMSVHLLKYCKEIDTS